MTQEKQPGLPGFGNPPAAAPPAGNADPPRSFNLVDEPWILTAASPERKSLRDVFSDPTLCRLSGNPVDKIVVFRLLLSIVQASTDLKDIDAWADLTVEKMAANALAYLDKWHDRFDLFGEHPFLQFPQLAGKLETIPSGADLIAACKIEEVSEGNNTVFSHWNMNRGLDLPELAVLLLRSVCFSCGKKNKTSKSICLSPQHEKALTLRWGTLLGPYGILHCYLNAETLLDSLRLNLLTDEDIRDINVFTAGKGVPFWEEMPQGEIDARAEAYKRSYLGQLFPLDKFLLIRGDRIIKVDGIGYSGFKDGFVDPAFRYVFDKKGTFSIKADPEKQPWRELPSLLEFLKADSSQAKTPLFLCLGQEKMCKTSMAYVKVWVGGMTVKNNSNEQKVAGKNGYVESEFSFPTDSLGCGNYDRFKAFMESLEKESVQLRMSVQGYFKDLYNESSSKARKKDLAQESADSTVARFWEIMSFHAQDFIDLTFSGKPQEEYDAGLDEWKKQWREIVDKLYCEICPRDTPRQLTAWVDHRPLFVKPKTGKEKKR